MKCFTFLIVVLLSTASFAEVKELTCTTGPNGQNATQLKLDEAAGTAQWIPLYSTLQPVPAAFTDTTVTFTVDSSLNGDRPEKFVLNRMTGRLSEGRADIWSCELSQQNF